MLLLAIANLALGYVAAAALIEPPLWSGLKLRLRRPAPSVDNSHKDSAPQPKTTTKTSAALPSLTEVGQGGRPTIAGLDELPAGWLVQLSNQGIVAHT